MNNLFYIKTIKKTERFLKNMFKDIGFAIKPKFLVESLKSNYKVYKSFVGSSYTINKLVVDFRILIFENLQIDSRPTENTLIINIDFGNFGNSIEIRKTCKIKDIDKNLDFIKETINKHFENFMI